MNYHQWPGNWSCSPFGWVPLMWAKPTVRAKEPYQCGGTKSTKTMMKEHTRWRMGPDEKSSSILSPFLLSRAVFSTWLTYPNHTSSKFWTSPRPGQCNWEYSAAIPAPIPVDVLHRQSALGQYKEGVKLSSKWDSVISQPLESQHLLSFDDQIQGIFKQNVPIRFIPKYHE